MTPGPMKSRCVSVCVGSNQLADFRLKISQLESASSSVTRMATEGAKATASGVEAQVVGAAAAGHENWLVVLWFLAGDCGKIPNEKG